MKLRISKDGYVFNRKVASKQTRSTKKSSKKIIMRKMPKKKRSITPSLCGIRNHQESEYMEIIPLETLT